MADGVTILIPNRHEPMLAVTLEALRCHLAGLAVSIHVEEDPTSTGIGATLRRGLVPVRTPWVIFVMADGSEDPYRIRQMVIGCLADRYDLVWGDRWTHPDSRVYAYPRWKQILNRLGNTLIGRIWGPRYGLAYTDWTDLAKGYRTARLRQLTWSDDFRCAVEIPVRYLRRCPRPIRSWITPMTWQERSAGRSSYRLRHALGCLRSLWTLWWEAQ